MAYSAFDDKSHEPQAEELSNILGPAATLWNDLVEQTQALFDPVVVDWVFSGKNWGWSLRLKQKKRAILYLTPSDGIFFVGLALGKTAVEAAGQSDLPSWMLGVIDNAPQYPEGRGIRLEVASADQVRVIVQLAVIKMAN